MTRTKDWVATRLKAAELHVIGSPWSAVLSVKPWHLDVLLDQADRQLVAELVTRSYAGATIVEVFVDGEGGMTLYLDDHLVAKARRDPEGGGPAQDGPEAPNRNPLASSRHTFESRCRDG